MAIMDTHEAFKLLHSAGLDEEKAEAIVRVVGAGQDALTTKADLEALGQTTKADLESLAQTTKADLESLAQTTKADLESLAQTTKADLESLAQTTKADLEALAQTTKADLEALELRLRHDLTLRLGAMVFAAAGVQVAIVGFLLAQFLPN